MEHEVTGNSALHGDIEIAGPNAKNGELSPIKIVRRTHWWWCVFIFQVGGAQNLNRSDHWQTRWKVLAQDQAQYPPIYSEQLSVSIFPRPMSSSGSTDYPQTDRSTNLLGTSVSMACSAVLLSGASGCVLVSSLHALSLSDAFPRHV